MQSNASSRRITNQALDIAWALWSELGVSGWNEPARIEAIDLEPLIVFTAWLGQFDSRLWEESLDWCVTNHRFVSTTRLQRLLKSAGADETASFRDYSATVRAMAPKISWPAGGQARPVRLSRKSTVPRLDHKTVVQLRMRALFGVAARSEVLRLLLIDRPRGWSAAELAQQANYAKVNVAAALDLLVLTGAISLESVGTQFRYRLARAPQMMAFIGPLPSFHPDWRARFAVVAEMVRLEQSPTIPDPTAQAAQRVGALRRIQAELAQLGLAQLAPRPADPNFVETVDRWARQLLSYWAGSQGPSEPSEAQYEAHRHESTWDASIRKPGEPDRPLTLPASDDEVSRMNRLVSSDLTGALKLAHELLPHASHRADRLPEPFRIQPEVLAFAEEQLYSIPEGGSRTFGEWFLRFWRAERVARMGMQATSARQ